MKKCEFCGREGEEETAITVNTSSTGICVLYPIDELICNGCLKNKSRYISHD